MGQLVTNGRKFVQYDYGKDENKEVYGTSEPPVYNLTRFSVSVYLIRSENDYLVTKEVRYLFETVYRYYKHFISEC